jgi:hypothetical protein
MTGNAMTAQTVRQSATWHRLLAGADASPSQNPAAQDPAAQALPPLNPPPPQSIVDWLTQLTLLYGVPFPYLVADPRLLPVESIRFFYLDPNWLNRCVDGALSVGVLSTAEDIFNEDFFAHFHAGLAAGQQALRATLRGKAPAATVKIGGTVGGFLMRSVVVSGWPGLEVTAARAGTPLGLLRMDRLASDVLLVLFDDVPDTVQIIEPAEGLRFGVEDVTDHPGTFQVALRWVNPAGGHDVGSQIINAGTPLTASTTERTGAGQPDGVLEIGALVTAIEAAMPAGQLTDGKLTAGSFAIQLVRGAGRVTLEDTLP